MSTYITGVSDYIPQIQPFKPNYNFLGNVLQTKQGTYDSNKQQISDLYGSVLYSPLSREGNIKRRDEFLKVIDQDIKKISGMDLSLQQNVDAAKNIFKGFTSDNHIINDMVKTKKLYKEFEKADAMKHCLDPDKCGGSYSEDSVRALQYRLEEFKNVSNDEALHYDMGTFTPHFNWQEKAMKMAKDQDFKVTQDSVNGQWIVTNTNGQLIQGGLYGIFKSVYGEDPRVTANYNDKAYVARKNAGKMGATQYGSEQKAEENYIQTMMQHGINSLSKNLKDVNQGYDNLVSTELALKKKQATKGLTKSEQEILNSIPEQKENIKKSQSAIQSSIDNVKNNMQNADINSLRRRVDIAAANAFEDEDLQNLAHSLANVNKSQTIKANPYAERAQQAGIERQMKMLQHGLDLDKLNHEYQLKLTLEDYKNGVKTGDIPTDQYQYVDAVPGSDVMLDVENNPELGFERNRAQMHKSQAESTAKTNEFLFNLFTSARAAVRNNPGENAGAKQYLEENFGPDWDKISDREGLSNYIRNSKKNSIILFNNALKVLPESKNPTGANGWAQDILKKHAGTITDIKMSNDAYLADIKHNTTTNKKIVDIVKGTATNDNPVAKYADLILTNGNFILADKEAPMSFIQKYISQKATEGEVVSAGDAEDAYDELKSQFYRTYNQTKGVSLEQGAGLNGTGMVSSRSLYATVDAKNKAGIMGDVVGTLSSVLAQPGTFTGVVGNSSIESLQSGNNDKINSFLTGLVNDVKKAGPEDKDRPMFNVLVSPIAAGSENTSAITISGIDPEYAKKYVGTKDNPGVLFGQDLSKGITLFYDNKSVSTPFAEQASMSNLEKVLKVKGSYTIDDYPEAGKVDFQYDDMSHNITATWEQREFIPAKNSYVTKNRIYNIDQSNLKSFQENVLANLKALSEHNIALENQVAESNKH